MIKFVKILLGNKKILSPATNFFQKTLACTQKLYELTLIDTRSCLFRPHKDKKTQTYITHTKVWINKIISAKEWNMLPTKYKRLSQPFGPQN